MAAAGLDLTKAAKRLGISPPGLWLWLTRNGHTEVRADLTDNSRYKNLSKAEIIRRLTRMVADGRLGLPLTASAQGLGVDYRALWRWRKQFCPDGAEAALLDYTDDDLDTSYDGD